MEFEWRENETSVEKQVIQITSEVFKLPCGIQYSKKKRFRTYNHRAVCTFVLA